MKLLPYLPLLILLLVPGTVHAAMEGEHLETHTEFVARKGYPESMEQWSDRHLLKAVDARVLHVVIYLGSQRGRLYANEQVVMDFPVCTGDRDHPTPAGTFTVLEKDKDHYSDLYGLAMPCFMRLARDGIGLHAGPVFRTPQSHGCIRMTRESCAALFNKIRIGTPVRIVAECVMKH